MSKALMLGSLDTERVKYDCVAERLRSVSVETVLVDTGVLGEPQVRPAVDRYRVAEPARTSISEFVACGRSRSRRLAHMAKGMAVVDIRRSGRLDGMRAGWCSEHR